MRIKNESTLDQTSSKRISFILATKNRSYRLEKTLKRLSKIKTVKDELIIVDGLSNDRTINVIKRYSQIIDLFISEADKGPAHAINKGILVAKGRYIFQVTDDDIYYKKSLEKALEILDKNTEIDLLVCGGIKKYGKKTKIICLPPNVNYTQYPENIFKYGASGVGFILRSSAISLLGLYPIGYASDIEYVLNAIRNKAVVKFCRVKLYKHIVYPHSITLSKTKPYMQHIDSLLLSHTSTQFFLYFKIKLLKKVLISKIHQVLIKIPYLKNFLYPYLVIKKHFTHTNKLKQIDNIPWDCGLN